MEFVNHTPHPALAFQGVDQHGQAFHVVVLRQTLTWGDDGQLRFADEQAPLCEADEHFGGNTRSTVRQESDLCHFKPRCDVIVNADAHAPLGADGQPLARFDVRLMVKRPDTLAPAADEDSDGTPRWLAGQRLIDKTLSVCGPRRFVRQVPSATTTVTAALRSALGKAAPAWPWALSPPMPWPRIPLRLEVAFGGACLLAADHPAAGQLAAEHRLSDDQRQQHPDAPQAPVAHAVWPANPWGRGFARDWFVQAHGLQQVDAPCVSYPGEDISAEQFMQVLNGQVQAPSPALDIRVASLGIRPKGHPQRAALVGTIDEAFVQGDAPLPPDFDFAVWNAAWPDQQTEHLQGDEVIGLMNLCAADTPGAQRDARGNVLLRLGLPGHLPFGLVRFANGAMGEIAAALDTVLIEPDRQELSCVWRFCVASKPAVRAFEARMLTSDDVAALRQANAEASAGMVAAAEGQAQHG